MSYHAIPMDIVTSNEEKLLRYILNGNQEEIKNFVKENDELMTYRYENYNKKTVLTIACSDERVKPETLNTLCLALKSKYKIDYIDELYYGWEPLHYVVKTTNFEKLEVLLEHTDNTLINSLTYFSENALHILLQYGHVLTPFGIVLHSGIETGAGNIVGPEKKDLVKCANLLIEKGVDINHTNFWNESPICLAVRYRYTNLIKHLLTIDLLDLDSFTESGQTIREYLKWNNFSCFQQFYVQENPSKIMFNLLKSGDEDRFLRYYSENFTADINSFDGDELVSCGTMLYFCLMKGYLGFIRDERSKIETSIGYNILDSPMLTVFEAKGFTRCIVVLLDNGADALKTTRKLPVTLLEYASLRGYYPFVAILLQHRRCKLTVTNMFDILSKLFSRKINLCDHNFYIRCVLYLILNKLIGLFSQNQQETLTLEQLDVLNEILHNLNLEANDTKLDDSEIICQILRLGARLSGKKGDKMVVERISSKILRSHFDDCISGSTFVYKSTVQDNNETTVLNFISNNKDKSDLMCHPLMTEFVHRKWSKVSWLFYADFVLYVVLMLSIYVSVLFLNFKFSYLYWYVYVFYIFYVLFIICFMILTCKECSQMYLYKCKYFKEIPNWLELGTILSSFMIICFPKFYFPFFSSCAIILGTFIFLLMLGQIPIFSDFLMIFSSIKHFIQYIAFYFLQFVSFAVCFYVLFPFKDSESTKTESKLNNSLLAASNNNNSIINSTSANITEPIEFQWGDLFKSLFYTLIFFTGEFSDRVLEPTQEPFTGRFFMTVFIFCMTIILNTLLVGLIVADMKDIQIKGRISKQVNLARFIQSINAFKQRNVFIEGQQKVFDNVDINNFDEENRKYLESIINKTPFDRYKLRDVYAYLTK